MRYGVPFLLALFVFAGLLRADELEAAFRDPPESAKPAAWWHWMGPNFSKQGITRDLEAMKDSGLSGATIFNITSAVMESQAPTENNPWPDQTYRSDKYWDALRHAASEAKRLGLKIGLHNTVGYSTTGGPWIAAEQGMKRLVWTLAEVDGGKAVAVHLAAPEQPVYKGWGGAARDKGDYYRDIGVIAVPVGEDVVPAEAVIDVTSHFRNDTLDWNAPAGRWKVYRFGFAKTGASPHPLPDDVIGRCLEADKINADVSRYHWRQVIDPLKQHLGEHLGNSFDHLLIDSYEAGFQNWTDGFRDEFKRRRGYDLLPWLATLGPAVTGDKKGQLQQTIGSAALTERFQFDLRSLVSDLYFENGFAIAREEIHKFGMHLEFEPYSGPFDTVECTPLADLPMGEFWTSQDGKINASVVASARAAGHKVIGAESFTGSPVQSKWSETPASLKRSCDGAFASGVNKMILHHWVHQPFDDRYQPGMGMGWWGTHFGRNQTWFEPGKEFLLYIRRSQALLQRGETPVAHVSVGKATSGGDAISWRDFRGNVTVKDGRIVLASGRTYAFLHVPHEGAMLPEDVRKIGALLEAGAVIVSKKPDRSPSLTDYPRCDEAVRTEADRIWGPATASSKRVGSGVLYPTDDVASVLAALRIEPTVRVVNEPAPKGVRTTCRRDGEALIVFVANQDPGQVGFTLSCDVAGKQPELWDAERGTIALAPVWREKNGRTEVDLRLTSHQSMFVVFRKAPTSADHATVIRTDSASWNAELRTDGRLKFACTQPISAAVTFASGRTENVSIAAPQLVPVAGPWKVKLQSRVETPRMIEVPTLISLSDHPDADTKYFSGTATYRSTFELPPDISGKRICLDMGTVADMARVAINGKDFGVVWREPFELDVSSAVQPGKNTVEIAVTNTWHNRLVGDEQEPADFDWGADRGPDRGKMMKGYPEWFMKDAKRPSSGRKCFVIWYYHRKDTPLLPSGLIGPVNVVIRD
jgi:hypothetical protein